MNLRLVLIILGVCAVSFCGAVPEQPTLSALLSEKTSMHESFFKPSADTVECEYEAFKTLVTTWLAKLKTLSDSENPSAAFSTIMMDLSTAPQFMPCINMVEYVLTKVDVITKAPGSTECGVPKTDPKWQTDPCCNFGLDKCCAPRTVNITGWGFGPYNTTTGPATCSKLDLVQKVGSQLASFLTNAKCMEAQQKLNKESSDLYSELNKCYSSMYGSHTCSDDDECTSGDCMFFQGGSGTGNCKQPTQEQSTSIFLDCLYNKLTPEMIRRLKRQWGMTGMTAEGVFFQKFKDTVMKSTCAGPRAYDPKTYFAYNQTTCMAQKGCNVYSYYTKAQCDLLTGAKCIYCPSIYYCYDASYMGSFGGGSAQANCEAGFCTANWGSNPTQRFTKAECDTKRICTLRKTDYSQPADKAECEALGACNDYAFWYGGGKCVFKFVRKNGWSTCDSGLMNYGFGCVKTQITDNTTCLGQGGTWHTKATNKEQCETLKLCIRKRYGYEYRDPLSQTECEKCGGEMKSYFKWNHGKWVAPEFFETEWVVPEWKSVNQWTPAIDYQGVYSLMNVIMGGKLAKTESECIPSTMELKVGDVEAFAGLETTVQGPSGMAVVKNNSVPAGSDMVEVGMTTELNVAKKGEVSTRMKQTKKWDTELNVAKKATEGSGSRRRLLEIDNKVYCSVGGVQCGVVVGQSYGLTFSGSVNNVQLCIDKDLTQTYDAKYTKADFAIPVADQLLTQSLDVEDTGSKLCGDVSKAGTYYPVLRDPSKNVDTTTPSPTPPPKDEESSAATISVSFVAMILCGLLILL